MRKFILLASFFACGFLFKPSAQGIAFEAPYSEGFHPLDEPSNDSPFSTENPAILKLNTTLFKDTSMIDFEKRQITFRRFDPLGYTMWEYHYAELSDYLLARRNFALYNGWQSGISVGKKNDTRDKQQAMKFQWELPVQYPSWAQRVLGNEPPSLRIGGSLKIIIGFDRSTLVQTYTDDNTSGGLNFDVEYNFSVTGSVGKLITINIKADKNNFEVSDIFKDFKIEYKESSPGELEDEILQEAQIGWTGFEMPGTALSGYSENHGGLFGIKTRVQLGPLSLTSIISHERGEAKKDTFYTEGGSKELPYAEDTYQKYRFFFLNNDYRSFYNRKHALNAPLNAPKAPEVTELQVWKRELTVSTTTDKLMERRNARVDDEDESYPFIKLLPERHYILNEEEGYIMFMDSTIPGANDQIAIILKTENPAWDKGADRTTSDTMMHLWTLKPKDEIDSASVDPTRFHLMWRNVYDLPALEDWSGFKLKVVQKNQETTNENEYNFENRRYSDILGITTDGVLKTSDDIIDKSHRVLIIPPYDTSFFGNEPFRNQALGEFTDTMIYTFSDERRLQKSYQPQFLMYKASSGRQTSFDLCWGMMQGEIVTGDGTKLTPDEDYVVDYDMGQLNLVSAKAKSCKMIVVEYQCESMFVPESKMFMGVRGEMKLPFISDKSFMGGSFLFQSVNTTDLIPQLNQEPFTKILLDFNTRLDWNPEWMTALVNKLPGIQTETASQVLFDFEIAHSIMNPNRNGQGQAYVDDFEDSNQDVQLPVGQGSWYQASPPFYLLDSTTTPDSLNKYPPAFSSYWFSPRYEDPARVLITDVKKPIQQEAKAGQRNDLAVLRLHCKPSPSEEYNSKYRNSWAGIMYPMPYSYKKRTESQYFEFYMAVPGGQKGKGKLLIQMGKMREDLSLNGGQPNKKGDYEDTAAGSDVYNPNAYGDGSQDLGLDRLPDSLEYYLIPSLNPGQLWDTVSLKQNRYLLGIDSLDPARDNFRSYDDEKDPISNNRYVCKLEKDNKLTSEDINNDYNVDDALKESYFQFTIDLEDTLAPYIDKQANLADSTIWRKYRIPLKEKLILDELANDSLRTDFNNPSWDNITFVRLIWTGFDSTQLTEEKQLILSEMQFIGSQWLPVLDSVGTKMEATSINTEDDLYYQQNIDKNLITREIGDGKDTLKESSLRVNFKNIRPGEKALVTKNYKYQNINITAYDTLSLALFGRPDSSKIPNHELLYNGKTDFLFRFGSDDSTYYEYRTDIYSGWQEVQIDLKQIANVKDKYVITHPEQKIDVDTVISGGHLRIYAPKGRQPTFSNITWMGLGVYSDSSNTKAVVGELWVDEMKVHGIGWIKGTAMRAAVTTKWADLLDINAGMEFEDGNFRRMTDAINATDNSVLSGNFSASMHLDKFLPSDLGISIPAGVNISGSITRPQVKNNTDVFLTDTNGMADNFMDIVTDAYREHNESSDTTASEHYEKRSSTVSAFVNYSKTTDSKNPLVNLTADRISAEFRYSQNMSSNYQGPSFVDSIGDYVIKDSSTTYDGVVRYDLTPRNSPSWVSGKPLEKSKAGWIPEGVKNYEFSLVPKKLSFDLANVNYGSQFYRDNKLGVNTITRRYDLTHGAQFSYAPISPLLNFDYSLNVKRDLKQFAGTDSAASAAFRAHRDSIWNRNLILLGEISRSQSASVNIDPNLFDWLPISADYKTDYHSEMGDTTNDYMNASITNSLSLNASLNVSTVVSNWAKATEKTAMKGFFAAIDSFFQMISLSSISFSYSATSNLFNNNIASYLIEPGRLNFLQYQFGLNGKDFGSLFSGDMNDDVFGGMNYKKYKKDSGLYDNDRRTVERTYSLSTSLSLREPQISFSPIRLNWSKRYEVRAKKYPSYIDTSVVFPDLSLGVNSSALMKLPVFSTAFQDFRVNSSFNYKKSYKNSSTLGFDTTRDFSMSPLIGVNGTIKKWPVTFSYNHNLSQTHTVDTTRASDKDTTLTNERLKRNSNSDEITINYQFEKSKLKEIKLLRWNIPIKGQTSMGMKISRDAQNEYRDKTLTVTNQSGYTVAPFITYTFTQNIDARLEYTYGKLDNKQTGEKTITNKGYLTISIQFN